MPPLRTLSEARRAELRAVLSRLRRTYKRIERIDAGRIEMVFYVRSGTHRGLQTVLLPAKYFLKHR